MVKENSRNFIFQSSPERKKPKNYSAIMIDDFEKSELGQNNYNIPMEQVRKNNTSMFTPIFRQSNHRYGSNRQPSSDSNNVNPHYSVDSSEHIIEGEEEDDIVDDS